jgi:hypothetical protein
MRASKIVFERGGRRATCTAVPSPLSLDIVLAHPPMRARTIVFERGGFRIEDNFNLAHIPPQHFDASHTLHVGEGWTDHEFGNLAKLPRVGSPCSARHIALLLE